MFERFTERARRVVVLAQEEARLLNHDYIGTEHILLGLIRQSEGVAARALEALGVDHSAVRREIERIIGPAATSPTKEHIPFTPRAKKVLELSLREAVSLGHKHIGTEHILLGLIREGEGVGAQVLRRLGAETDRVRDAVSGLVGTPHDPASVPEPPPEEGPVCPRCRALLGEFAAYRVIEVPAADHGEARRVAMAFCRRCGTLLGPLA